MIYSVLQFVASDFILFLLCILIDYHIVIRMNIHGLVYKQLLFFFFSSLTMVLVTNSLCHIKSEGNNAS